MRLDNAAPERPYAIELEPKLHTWVFSLKARSKAHMKGKFDDDERLTAEAKPDDLGKFNPDDAGHIHVSTYESREAKYENTITSAGGLLNVAVAKNKLLRNWKRAKTWGPGSKDDGAESLEGIPLILVTRRRRTRYVAKTDKDGVATVRIPTDDYILTAGMIPIRASNEDDDPATSVSRCDVSLYKARKVAMLYYERAHLRLQEAMMRAVRRRRLARHIDYSIARINVQMHRWLRRTRLRKARAITIEAAARAKFGRDRVKRMHAGATPLQALARRNRGAAVAAELRDRVAANFPRFCEAYGKRLATAGIKKASRGVYIAKLNDVAADVVLAAVRDDELEAERQKIRDMQARVQHHRDEKAKKQAVMRVAAERHEHRRKTRAVVKMCRFFRGGFGGKKKAPPEPDASDGHFDEA